MDPMSLEDRIKQAIERESRRPPIEGWNALVARAAIDETGRVLLKAPWPMMGESPRKRRKRREKKA